MSSTQVETTVFVIPNQSGAGRASAIEMSAGPKCQYVESVLNTEPNVKVLQDMSPELLLLIFEKHLEPQAASEEKRAELVKTLSMHQNTLQVAVFVTDPYDPPLHF